MGCSISIGSMPAAVAPSSARPLRWRADWRSRAQRRCQCSTTEEATSKWYAHYVVLLRFGRGKLNDGVSAAANWWHMFMEAIPGCSNLSSLKTHEPSGKTRLLTSDSSALALPAPGSAAKPSTSAR